MFLYIILLHNLDQFVDNIAPNVIV